MKKIFNKLVLLVCAVSSIAAAQTIYSNGSGGGLWSDPSTWQGGVVPTVNDDVFINGTDSVYTAAGARCNSLTLYSGARFATGIDTVQVVTLLTVEDDAWFYNATTEPELPGSNYDLYDQSYVVHSGSGTVGGVNNYEFGNLVIKRNEGCTPGTNLIISGNLIVSNTAANVVFRGCRPATGSLSHTVFGNVYINKGTFSCVDVGDITMVGIWNIFGNVYVIDPANNREARIGPFSSANAAGLGIFNIDGDILIDGGRIQAGTSSSQGLGTAIFNIGGNMTLTSTAGVSASTHLGPFAINFVGNGTQNVTSQIHFTFNTDVFDTVKTGSTVVFDLDTTYWRSTTGGIFVVNGSLEMKSVSRLMGAGSFALNSGATLKIGSLDGIYTSGTIGNIQVSGTRNYSADASYEYKGSGTQSLGGGLPNPVYGFGVNNPSGIILDRDLTVNGLLKVINGDLELNDHTITLGSNATLTETAGNTITGSLGKITITTDVNAPSGTNIGGLGAWISSGANLGSTTIERFHSPRTGSGNQGINRYFNISPANNSGLNATFRFYYDESELSGIPEDNLRLYKSPDGSDNSWSSEGGTVNASSNYVEKSEVNDFSYWTLADKDHPLPVEKDEDEQIPDQYALYQNYPNPFNPETVIKFELPEQGMVTLKIYNTLGEEVATLVNEQMEAGTYYYQFHANHLSSGVYLYKLSSENFSQSYKMILMK